MMAAGERLEPDEGAGERDRLGRAHGSEST
jgi:hypothetical protein